MACRQLAGPILGRGIEMGATDPDRVASRAWWIEWFVGGKSRRVELTGRVSVGRSKLMDVVIDDPYASRDHCTLELEGGGVRVDASHSTNLIVVDGRDMKCAMFHQAGSFSIGQTLVQLRPASATQDTTLHLSRTTPTSHSAARLGSSCRPTAR